MNEIKHVEFAKIPRLSKALVYISEKIDGTNAAIRIEEGKITAIQSRQRLIEVGSDNYGFAAWVRANESTLIEDLGDGLHFGEWCGKGVNGGPPFEEKHFFLFDTRHAGREWKTRNLSVVPLLATHSGFNTEKIKEVVEDLRQHGSYALPGFMKPEGIIVFVYNTQTRFKVLLENDAFHKGELK